MTATAIDTCLNVAGSPPTCGARSRDVDGLILSSGEQVQFPPPNGVAVVVLLGQQPGATHPPGERRLARGGGDAADWMMTSEARPHRRSLWALDRLNIFGADVRTGVGPYLAIYLQASRHWDPAHIGLAMSAMGLASIAAQTPAGALTDRLRQKRAMLVAAAMVVAIGCLWIVIQPTLAGVLVAQALIGSTATIFPASIAAITLGLVGPANGSPQMTGEAEMHIPIESRCGGAGVGLPSYTSALPAVTIERHLSIYRRHIPSPDPSASAPHRLATATNGFSARKIACTLMAGCQVGTGCAPLGRTSRCSMNVRTP